MDVNLVLLGYLDQPWSSNSKYINSSKPFIFSTTTKLKANVATEQYGARGNPNLGPSFGYGYDLVMLYHDNGKGYMNPHSYTGTAKLIGAKNYPGSGESYFKALEVEVYTLG